MSVLRATFNKNSPHLAWISAVNAYKGSMILGGTVRSTVEGWLLAVTCMRVGQRSFSLS